MQGSQVSEVADEACKAGLIESYSSSGEEVHHHDHL
jgi:hypothetical protein